MINFLQKFEYLLREVSNWKSWPSKFIYLQLKTLKPFIHFYLRDPTNCTKVYFILLGGFIGQHCNRFYGFRRNLKLMTTLASPYYIIWTVQIARKVSISEFHKMDGHLNFFQFYFSWQSWKVVSFEFVHRTKAHSTVLVHNSFLKI